MRYYSDILNEFFDTEKECKEAETDYLEDMIPPDEDECCYDFDRCEEVEEDESEEVEEVEEKEEVPTKKNLADRVQKSEDALKEAYELYSVAEKKAEELSKIYLEEVGKIMSPAKKAVNDAEEEKYRAIKDFNDAYGVYRVSYTGARAAEEFNRALRKFKDANKWLEDIFRLF